MWFGFFLGILTGVLLSAVGMYSYRKIEEIKSRVPFSIRVSLVPRPLPAYVIEAKGDLKNKGEEISYVLNVEDHTDGVISPILFKNEEGEKCLESLEVLGPTVQVKHNTRLSDWSKIVTLPAERVRFSHKGTRELNFFLSVNGSPVLAQEVLGVEQQEAGFVDVQENLPDICDSIWYLVMGLRSKFPDYSSLIIERAAEFLVKESELWHSDERSLIFDSFREIAEAESPTIDWNEACESYAINLRDIADDDTRNDVMRLFFTLLIDDDGIQIDAATSLMVFYKLCIGIGLDMGAFTRLVDRFVMSHDLRDVPPGCLLGLYVGMDMAAAKTRLMEEYKKWNARVTHSDVKIRDRAAHMMQLISTARAELK